MKILKLRFKNLNSLVGEWSIDFTVPEYTSDGIFAISGPTGSGKSTILDAICLALYGRTPRLKVISKTTNELMSRQTGVCFAEVVFETDKGRYRAFWSQWRAREKASGALQDPRHEISNADTGAILASQLSTAEKKVEDITGMDYGRFVQSMMLAQGNFAAFLQATGNERAPILEQITGTEIYSDISKYVFERHKSEGEKLRELIAENRGITILSPDEAEQIGKELEEKNSIKIIRTKEKENIENAISWLKKINDLKSDLSIIEMEEKALAEELNEFQPRLRVLKNAKRAMVLDGEYANVMALRKQQNEDGNSLKSYLHLAPELKNQAESARAAFDAAESNFGEIRKKNEDLLKLTLKVRSTDQEIAQTLSGLGSIETAMGNLQADKAREADKIQNFRNSISSCEGELEAIQKYLSDNSNDASLIAELAGIRAEFSSLGETRDQLMSAKNNLAATRQNLEKKLQEITRLDQELTVLSEQDKKELENIGRIINEINKLLEGKKPEEIQQRKDQLILHLAELRKIADLDTERKLLEDGKPCPLCGSLDHPYSEGNIPSATDSERELEILLGMLSNYGVLNQKLTELREKGVILTEKLGQVRNQRDMASQQISALEENTVAKSEEVERLNISLGNKTETLIRSVRPFGVAELPENREGLNSLADSLEKRKNSWLAYEKRKTEADDSIKSLHAEIKVCTEIINAKESDLRAKTIELESQKKRLEELKIIRLESFGEKNVNEEEEKSRDALQKAEESRSSAREVLQAILQKLSGNENRINDLKTNIANRQVELDNLEDQFAGHVARHGFADEADFISCRLPAEEREQLEMEANRLDTMKTSLTTRRTDRQRQLTEESSRNLTDESLDNLVARLSETTLALDMLLQETGALSQRIQSNNEARAKGELIGQKINIQSRIVEKWSRLNDLIGSREGTKYRNFAQGLTFEIVVSHANSQLSKLSDRYLLIRDREKPLELNVVDNYQAGEIRSTKNLSGGESFIVSLALALGLSRMAGRNVRVDSLFLDEGFGTLDDETLETALGTLASLRQDGKMIGVISHVGAMKDRINAKILVQPVRGGRSIITGPGCEGK